MPPRSAPSVKTGQDTPAPSRRGGPAPLVVPSTAADLPSWPDDPARLRAALLAWYDGHRRELPWRAAPDERADPWAVLVSEIMLQQTTVAMAAPRYPAFLARFPTASAMAAAPLDEVLHAWAGLGYYRRARALHAAALTVRQDHDGILPSTEAALRALPGIGAYTAAAVAAIAFGVPTVPVDGNVVRVLARLSTVTAALPGAKRTIDALAVLLAGPERPGDLAQALMDLGATVCVPRRPLCEACPWSEPCRARAMGIAASLPRAAARVARPERHGIAYLLLRDDGALLLERRPDQGLLGGMMAPPIAIQGGLDRRPAQAVAPPGRGDEAWEPLPGAVRHVFTHFMLTLEVQRACAQGRSAVGSWHRLDALHDLALPTLARKILAHAGLGGRDAHPALSPSAGA